MYGPDGSPGGNMDSRQSIVCGAARLIYHSPDALISVTWQRASERIQFRRSPRCAAACVLSQGLR
jgi:hypothetical protein